MVYSTIKELGWRSLLKPATSSSQCLKFLHSKEFACNAGDLGWEDPLEKENGNPLQYSCLDNSTDRGAWWATVHGVTKSWTWLGGLTFAFFFFAKQIRKVHQCGVGKSIWKMPTMRWWWCFDGYWSLFSKLWAMNIWWSFKERSSPSAPLTSLWTQKHKTEIMRSRIPLNTVNLSFTLAWAN